MPETMTPEILAVAVVSAFTGVIWIPIILNRLREMGMWTALKNPQPDTRPEAEWAYRAANAHRNAIENLVVFAPLAISVHVLGLGNDVTALAAWIFIVARLAHAVIYTLGVPLLRTIAFAAGFASQMLLAARLFGGI